MYIRGLREWRFKITPMSNRNYYRGKYVLTKEEFLSAKYYALRYNQWLAEYNSLKDSVGAVVADDMPHAVNNISAPTEKLATRRAELKSKMQIIEDAARETDEQIGMYILIMATTPEMTFDRLKAEHKVPCERDMFYDCRRKFYWLLSKKI